MKVSPNGVEGRAVVGLSLLLFAAGCTTHQVGLSPHPVVGAPPAYSIAPQVDAVSVEMWWQAFDDARLNALIEASLEENLTVAQALERIDRAEFVLRRARATPKPQVDLSTRGERSYERERLKDVEEESGLDQIQSALSELEPSLSALDSTLGALRPEDDGGDLGPGSSGKTQGSSGDGRGGSDDTRRTTDSYVSQFSTGLSLSWELDFWGRLRSESKARGEELAAVVYDYETLRLLLSSQVADAYYQALEQRLQHDLLMQQLESGRTILDLLELRFLQGAASLVDVLQQRGQLADIEAEIPVVQAQLRLLENRLDVLMGRPPDGNDLTDGPEPSLPPTSTLPPLGVPVDLLQNRPDLKALQRRVVAADYRIASAIAERFPRITLDGSMRYGETPDAATFTAAAAADLLQPLWDWGQRQAAVLEARSSLQEALLSFSQAYLIALEEVETTLWQEFRQRELIDALARREEILQQTVNETRVRYSLGVTDYLPVLTAVQDLQDVQRELLRQRRVQVSLRVQLYRAIGGGVAPRANLPGIQPMETAGPAT